MARTIVRKYRFVLTIVLLFIFLRLPSLFEPYWYGDEGIYLVLGQAIRKGLLLYQQIHDNKPPTLYYLAAFSQTIFGFRLLLAVFMAGATFYFNLLSNRISSPKLSRISTILFIIITSIPLIEGNIANAEVFMLLPTIAGIYYFLYSKSSYNFLVTGLLLGIAFTIKVPVAIELVFLCAWLFINNLELSKIKTLTTQYLFLFLGFLIPISLYFLYFTYLGAANDFLYSALLQNFGYLSSWATGSHSGTASNGGLASRGIILLISWLILYILSRKKIISPNILFIFGWFTATIFGALLSTRPYPHYLLQVVPPLVLIITYLFSDLANEKQRYISVALIVSLAFYIINYRFYFYPVFSYYGNFYSHLFNLRSTDYRIFFGSRVNDSYTISEYIKNHTSPQENIFIWGDEPYIYALSNRLPVGRFTVAYHIVDFNQYQATYDQLKVQFPRIIVYYPQENRPFPELTRFVKLYYSPSSVIGDATIYTRND